MGSVRKQHEEERPQLHVQQVREPRELQGLEQHASQGFVRRPLQPLNLRSNIAERDRRKIKPGANLARAGLS